ncbi:uncharacterized protein LOC128013099 [Carassius gibelio]|uniref:uncharacterized protein LOC128013099 n=1 Tax=Carassius gibelio TaxID=101364 RepID=UPI0022788445|nr:uncharacterized protein LOC128013099 [Carassius gibelio]
MSNAKAVLQGCDDYWTLQEKERMPVLFQTTVCVDIQVLSPGEWTAFNYVSAPAPSYELALQGDANNLYAWLLGVRHQFPVQLTTNRWYHICLRLDAPRKSFSLTIGGNSEVFQRTVIARTIRPSGRLLLGCQPNKASPGAKMATVELYLFRIWDDVGEHKACEDGTVIGWDSRLWAITRAQARVQDYTLQCGLGHLRMKRSADSTTTSSTSQVSASTPEFVSTSSPLQMILTSIITGSLKSITQGKGLCPEHDIAPSGGGFVYCTSPMSYEDFCKTQGPVSVTCSYNENGFIPKEFTNQFCNETYYAVRLNITSPDVNFIYIQNMYNKYDTQYNNLTSQHNRYNIQNNNLTSQHNRYNTQYINITNQYNKYDTQYDNPTSKHNRFTIQYNHLTSQHKRYNRHYNNLISKHNSYFKRYTNITIQYNPTSKQNRYTIQYNNITSQHNRYNTQYNDLTSQHNGYNTQYNNLTNQHNRYNKQYNNLTNQHNRYNKQYKNPTSQHNRYSRQYNNLTSQHNRYNTQYNKLTNQYTVQYNNLTSQHNRYNRLYKKLPSQYNRYLKQYTNITNQYNKYDTQYNNPTSQCNSQRNRYNIQYNNFTSQHNRCNTQYNNLTSQQARYNTQYYKLTNQHNRYIKQYTNITKQYNKYDTQYNNPTSNHNRYTIQYNNLTSQHNRYIKHYTNITKQYNKYDTQYNNPTSKHNRYAIQYNNLTSQHNRYNTQYNNLTSQHNRYNTQYNNLTSRYNRYNKQYNNLTSQHNNQHNRYNTQYNQLTSQHKRYNKQQKNLTSQHNRYNTQYNKLANQHNRYNLTSQHSSLDLGRTVLSVINNFLNSSTDTVSASSNRLIKAVDNLGLKLVIGDQTENIAFNSLALTVTKVDGTNFGKTSLTIADPLNPQVTKGLQRQVRAVESSSPMAKITLPASLTENLSPEEKKIASRVQFTFFQKSTFFQDKTLSPKKLNSYILGSSVANLSIKNLRENVIFTLRNQQPIAGNYVASCVFWDFDQNGGLGGWNGSGCSVTNSSTENETVCSCNHLTSFAVLLDISRQGISDRLQNTILTFITYIGCGVSAIFLSVTLITYLAFEKLRHDIPSKILIHLCFGLLMLNLVFLVDSWLALYKDAVGLCISTAFFLHYFLLVSFTWMGLEALHMYLAIVKVFNNFMSRYMLKFSLAGWGIPLVVVIIVIAVNKDNYGLVSYGKFSDGTTDEFCWLSNDIAFYVAVVAYFCVVFVLNLAMFVVVMVHLRRIKRRNPHNNLYRSGLHDLRSIAGLTFLLGLTWGFAFFAWGPVNLAFSYLFAIFNSLQGFFIFVFHCALKENVRKHWRMYLCCGSLRLAENSEWSRTATQSNHTKKTSIMTADSGTRSVPRSSVSSDESVPSQGIGSMLDDSVIMSGEANDDVIINEMNRQIYS